MAGRHSWRRQRRSADLNGDHPENCAIALWAGWAITQVGESLVSAALTSRLRSEVEQQSYLDPRRAQVVEQLSFGCGREHLPGLRLDKHAIVHEQIEAVRADDDSLVTGPR
jgi:hypothetical protein